MFKRRNHIIITLGLMVIDLLTLAAAFWLSYFLRLRLHLFANVQPISDYYLAFAVFTVITLFFFGQQGLYRDIRDLSMIEEYASIIKSLTYAFLIALALTFFFKFYERSRVLVFLFWALANLFVITVRFFWYRFLKFLHWRRLDLLNVAVVGSEQKSKAVRQLLKQHPQLGYHIVATVVLPRGISPKSGSLQQKLEREIVARFQKGEIDGVIISDSVKNYQQTLEVNELFTEYEIPHRNVTEAFDLTGFKTPAGEGLEGLLTSLKEGQIGGGYKVFKRFMDEIVSLTALLVTLPLWLLIMAAIKLESKGPVFFKQERVGYHGRKFLIYKFRSMVVTAPQYAKTPKGTHDPRITALGRILRRTSLDELPQLLNVIKGDMSLVGPRPEMPFLVEKYKPIYRYRLLVLPGVTGLWQVSGRTDKPLEENVKYDLYYIKNQSFLLDLVIILRTVPAVLFGKGAY